MPKQNRKFGDWGERLAQDFLQKRGYEILDRNFQRRCGEIDIVACKDDVLHFIEVKTRTLASIEKFGHPQEAVTGPKQRKIIQTAFEYITEKDCGQNKKWQIDVISIIYSKTDQKAKISFIANAFGEE